MTPQEFKFYCLKLVAETTQGKGLTAEEIVATAAKFEAFVNTPDIQPQ